MHFYVFRGAFICNMLLIVNWNLINFRPKASNGDVLSSSITFSFFMFFFHSHKTTYLPSRGLFGFHLLIKLNTRFIFKLQEGKKNLQQLLHASRHLVAGLDTLLWDFTGLSEQHFKNHGAQSGCQTEAYQQPDKNIETQIRHQEAGARSVLNGIAQCGKMDKTHCIVLDRVCAVCGVPKLTKRAWLDRLRLACVPPPRGTESGVQAIGRFMHPNKTGS